MRQRRENTINEKKKVEKNKGNVSQWNNMKRK